MTITGATLSAIQDALKRFYIGPLRNQLNNSTVLLSRLQRNQEDVSGDTLSAYVPLIYGRNQGVGARADGASLPSAKYRKAKQTVIPLRYNYGRIEVTGPAIAGSRNAAAAFMKVVDYEIRGMVEGLKVDINRQLHGDGTGYLCQINGSSSGTTVTVDNPGTQYLESDMTLDTVTGETASTGTGVISSITSSTVFVVTPATSYTNDHYLVRTGSYNVEMMGLKGIVDDTTYITTLQGIDRDTYTWFKANVLGNGGTNRALTLDLMQQASDAAEKQGGRISLIISNYELRRKYADLLVADKRFVNKLTLDGGFSALEYSAGGEPLPFVVDRHSLDNTMKFLDESTLAIYRASDFDWMDKFCSSKILLYAGKSGEYYDPNEGTVHSRRQSAGKTNAVAWRVYRWRGFFFNNTQKNQRKTFLLSRHLNSEHKSIGNRPMCGYDSPDLWISHRNQISRQMEKTQMLENTDFGFQEMHQVSSRYNPFSLWEKRGSGVGVEICSDLWRKFYSTARTDETATKSNSESSETIRKTVSNTEDIVRADMRVSELSRNALALLN